MLGVKDKGILLQIIKRCNRVDEIYKDGSLKYEIETITIEKKVKLNIIDN